VDLYSKHYLRQIPAIIVPEIAHSCAWVPPKLTKSVTICPILPFGRDCNPDHTLKIAGSIPAPLAGFRDDGHNPRAYGCEGIYLRQTWHISCLTLPRASWSFRPCRWGPFPPRGIKGLGLRGHHTVS
jgi:hypothetical protein